MSFSTQPKKGNMFTTSFFTGTVAQASKNMETKVHGGGGGGFTYKGTGASSNVKITSTTVVHDELFLIAEDGSERAFQLQDINIACREGNRVTVVTAQNGSKTQYVGVINHSTGNAHYNDKVLIKFFVSTMTLVLCFAVLFGGLILIKTIIAPIAAGVFIYWINKGIKEEMRQYKDAVRQKLTAA